MRNSLKKIKPFLSRVHLLSPLLFLFYYFVNLKRNLINLIKIHTRKTIPILLYHRVDIVSYDPVMLVINPETFEKHMKFLIKYYEPISLSELASRINSKSIQGNEICITFDDGYKDNLTNAIPILKKYNIPATIFITTANIGKQANHDWDIKYKENERAYFLSEDEIIECSKNPLVEIGAHTHTHKRLSDLTFNEQITEIETSKKILEKVTCNKIMHFAYPFGSKLDFNKNSVKIVKNLGFISAYENTGLLGTNNSNIYSFPRINIRECPVEKISRQLYNSK